MITSNSPELDKIRDNLNSILTSRDNFELRILWLRLWVCTLQQLGIDLTEFLPIDTVFRKYFYWNLCRSPNGKQRDFSADEFEKIAEAISLGYTVLEKLYAEYSSTESPDNPDIEPLSISDQTDNPGDEWPLYGGDHTHSAYTNNAGPENGKVSWKFPVGLARYSRPLIHDDKIIVASPGIRTVLKCFTIETGKELWRSTQLPDIVGDQLYWSPCHAGTPILNNDKIYVRDMGSRGNAGITKSVSVFSAVNGEILGKVDSGHVDYRCGYPPLAGNDRFLVVPFAIHDIHLDPPVTHPFNQIKIYDIEKQTYLNTINTGHLFGEPIISDNNVYFADSSGYIYAFLISEDELLGTNVQIQWQFKTDSAMNSGLIVSDGYIISGSNEGSIYCIHKDSGELRWETKVSNYEKNSFKQFSKPYTYQDQVFIGCSNSSVIQLDVHTGEILSMLETDDWVRSRPIVIDDIVYAASLSGSVSLFNVKDNTAKPFLVKKISSHAVLADLETDGKHLFAVDSDLNLSVFDTEMSLKWKSSIIDAFDHNGSRIFIDQIAGGAYYQSKPTVANGKVFIGSPSRFIYAIDEFTGKEIWKSEMGGAISAAPSFEKNRIYAGQQGGEDSFYCLDSETGRKIWTQSLGWVWGSANIKDNNVFVPCIDGFVSCLDAENGRIKWRYRTAKSTCTEPAIDEDRVFFGGWDQILHAFEAETGKILWQYQLGASSDSGAQIALDGKIFVPSGGNLFRCLNNKTGDLIWKFVITDASFNASPACDENSVYISVWDGLGMAGIPIGSWIHKLDMNTGRKIWSAPGGGLTAPVVARDKVYFASTTSPYFSCVSREPESDGSVKIIWKIRLGNKVEESCTAIANRQAFILSSDGFLYAIN
ncbi:MAG: PQQ-binding-like beta-propeller repeat protein [Bacteroidetes bacterium]|nr:PQQ-binding-like beta-propeller repeat protein [Bacteroidota bacterium]